ncbi:hypothetical protein Nepgr_022644 [Nepenthes gracilis]|uniref:YTH domain-containing protein n=1 Tax=Nepenthes gracilis TaxID=150966 RepID=A0AAD3XX04_NEPGR|nr:hypothetical protein Nepgr_022644 [Nepenthes gracilis]
MHSLPDRDIGPSYLKVVTSRNGQFGRVMGTKGLSGSAGLFTIESSDSWKDDCVGTMSSSRSLPASTYLERTKIILGYGALGASVGTDLSSVALGNGKDRTGMKWDIDQRRSKYMVMRKLHANAKSILDQITQKQDMWNLDDPESSSYRATKDIDPSTAEEPRFGESLIESSCAVQKMKKISTRNFIIKSLNHHNIQLSIEKGNWATQVMNKPILEEAFDNSDRVILVFSANMTGFFQSYAQMMSSVGCRWGNVWSQGTGGNSEFGVVLAWVLVENVIVRVDCVISDDESSSASSSADKSHSPFVNLLRVVFGNIFKPLQALGLFLSSKRSGCGPGIVPSSSALSVRNGVDDEEAEQGDVTHHSPTQVLRNFNEIRLLKIELPSGELGIDDGVLLKWRADFGSTLDNCVILGASSVVYSEKPTSIHENSDVNSIIGDANAVADDNGSIPESFYTNGGLKLRVVWTISSLIAASARHYLLQPIIAEHETLDSLVLTDADGQGVLCMNRDQLEELRVKPLSASSASKRTLVPALNMRLWYAPHLELPDGVLLKGATLVAIRPIEQSGMAAKKDISDLSWKRFCIEL